MVSTFQAFAVALVAVLPGAFYTFAFEGQTGNFSSKSSDRLVRFLASSALFDAVMSGPALWLYRSLIVSGRLARGKVNVIAFEGGAIAYVLIPTIAGVLVGYGMKHEWRWVIFFFGTRREPRAWDYVWNTAGTALVRLRLTSGIWLAGLFATTADGRVSFAAGYPEEQDLYLAMQLRVDPDTGAFLPDDHGQAQPVEGAGGLLLRWSEIEFIEYQELPHERT